MNPSVSVIIPYFEGETFIEQALRSLYKEKIPGLEILLVDDGSKLPFSSRGWKNLKVIRRKKNGGPPAAMNTGILAARGKVLGFLDQDDILATNGLKWRLEWLTRHPSAEVVCGRFAGFVDRDGNRIAKLTQHFSRLVLPFRLGSEYEGYIPPPMGLYLFRRQVFDRVGLFDESFKVAFDRKFLSRLLHRETVYHLRRNVYFVRYHEGNFSLKWDGQKTIPSRRALAEISLSRMAEGALTKQG